MKEKQFDSPMEFARVIEWAPPWSFGAPLPQIFSNGNQTYLTYFIDIRDPNSDGSYTTLIDNKSDTSFPIAIVTFIQPDTHRFGIVNDEAANGHPLYEKGLEVYHAHIIENSSWIEELKSIHKVHPRYSDEHWVDYKHFLLFFHDEIFEIIAKDFKIEVITSTFNQVAIEVASRLNSER